MFFHFFSAIEKMAVSVPLSVRVIKSKSKTPEISPRYFFQKIADIIRRIETLVITSSFTPNQDVLGVFSIYFYIKRVFKLEVLEVFLFLK